MIFTIDHSLLTIDYSYRNASIGSSLEIFGGITRGMPRFNLSGFYEALIKTVARLFHSYRNASIGSSREAFCAG